MGIERLAQVLGGSVNRADLVIELKIAKSLACGIAAALALFMAACTPRSGAPEASACAAAPHTLSSNLSEAIEGIFDPAVRRGGAAFLCGFTGPEDIVQIGETGWLVASSFAGLGAPVRQGRLYLIDAAAKTQRELFPGPSPELRPDAMMYPSCPGLDLNAFDTLGLSVREKSRETPGVYRLYVTSHGAVSAVQAFEIDARGKTPTIAWVGCVPMPPNVWANSVTILEDGGFVVTQFFDPSDPESVKKSATGQSPGALYEWRPGGAVVPIPGTDLIGLNGLVASGDGRYLFASAMHSQVVRFDMSTSPPAKVSLTLPIVLDNLRSTPKGDLLAVGWETNPSWVCKRHKCEPIYRIDPQTMTARLVVNSEQPNASMALEVGDTIWVGTWVGDRVGYLPTR
jgi:hypothetical protein